MIVRMSLQDRDPCNDTYVDILNGEFASSPSLGRFCRRPRRFVLSQTNHLRIVYHTNASVARVNSFRIIYQVRTRGIVPPSHLRFSAVLIAVLRDIHLLPVRQRIIFKLAMTVFKCIHGLAPSYLANDCVIASSVASR